MKTSGFDRVFFVQDKNKLNCIGEGTVSFEVRADTTKDAKLIFEMSSRELYSREMNEEAAFTPTFSFLFVLKLTAARAWLPSNSSFLSSPLAGPS